MKTITVSVSIQFDADQITEGTPLEQAQAAVYLINQTLQREPYGLGVQILSSGMDSSDVTISGDEDEQDMD